jgi:hypothetical protein
MWNWVNIILYKVMYFWIPVFITIDVFTHVNVWASLNKGFSINSWSSFFSWPWFSRNIILNKVIDISIDLFTANIFGHTSIWSLSKRFG